MLVEVNKETRSNYMLLTKKALNTKMLRDENGTGKECQDSSDQTGRELH